MKYRDDTQRRYAKWRRVCIMPDIHAGKGCTIGSTKTIKDKEESLKKEYHISLTIDEFVDKYDVDSECVWYAPAISCGTYITNHCNTERNLIK